MKPLKTLVLLFTTLILLAIVFSSCGGGRDIASNAHGEAVHSDTRY